MYQVPIYLWCACLLYAYIVPVWEYVHVCACVFSLRMCIYIQMLFFVKFWYFSSINQTLCAAKTNCIYLFKMTLACFPDLQFYLQSPFISLFTIFFQINIASSPGKWSRKIFCKPLVYFGCSLISNSGIELTLVLFLFQVSLLSTNYSLGSTIYELVLHLQHDIWLADAFGCHIFMVTEFLIMYALAFCSQIPFFVEPSHDCIVECLPTCQSKDNPPKYVFVALVSKKILPIKGYICHQ